MSTKTVEAYPEPDASNDDYPDEWTPKQREYWDQYCQPIYGNLKTDVGKKWFRRTYRPKKQRQDGRSGMMKRDHVQLGTPEDYVAYNVNDATDMWSDLTGAMMRELSRFSVDKSELDTAVSDIVQAKLQLLSTEERQRLGKEAKKVANLYGIELEE